MEILITGGAGFIGSHLTEFYLRNGHRVTVVDDLSTGSMENLAQALCKPDYDGRLALITDTVLNEHLMERLITKCDLTLHLAAAVGVRYVIDHPLSCISTNVYGTELILKACSRHKKKLFLASTSEVYGKNSTPQLQETADHIFGSTENSRWGYAASKLLNELTALAYHRVHGLQVFIARLFNVVGPRQTGRYGMVVPRFVGQALAGVPITVYGDGSQTRTFTHVDEAVIAITRLLDTPEAAGQVVNIGGPKELSILELAHRVKALSGSSSPIERVPYEEAFPDNFEDMQQRAPSLEKLLALTGYAPGKEIDSILAEVIVAKRQRAAYQGA